MPHRVHWYSGRLTPQWALEIARTHW